MNYLDFFNKKYRHISSNANGNNILDMLNITLNISKRTIDAIVRKAGLINQRAHNMLINKNNILIFISKKCIR
jgi:hypothetical protein